jgi:hypothetical protein
MMKQAAQHADLYTIVSNVSGTTYLFNTLNDQGKNVTLSSITNLTSIINSEISTITINSPDSGPMHQFKIVAS